MRPQSTRHRTNTRRAAYRRSAAPTILIIFCIAVFSLLAYGQYRVNNQIYGNPGPSVKYGYGPGYATPRTVQLMPSENRNLYYSSNGTPSASIANAAAMGPLASGGRTSYIPSAGPNYRVASVGTSGNWVNNSVGPIGASSGIKPMSPVSTPSMNGSIRYSGGSTAGLQPVSGFTFNNSMPSGQPTMSQVFAGSPNGSIKYAMGN